MRTFRRPKAQSNPPGNQPTNAKDGQLQADSKNQVAPTKAAEQTNVYAFIDSQNLNVGVQKYGWKMDWRRFRKFLADQYGVTKAYMFIGYVPEFESMYEQLHESGYMIVLKPTYDMTRPQPELAEGAEKPSKEEEKPVKGNIDADLVLWAMKEINNYDKAIIVSGDGDFYSLIEYLVEQGKLSKLLAPNQQFSNLYNKYEQYVERLDHYKRDLQYYDHKKKRTSGNGNGNGQNQ